MRRAGDLTMREIGPRRSLLRPGTAAFAENCTASAAKDLRSIRCAGVLLGGFLPRKSWRIGKAVRPCRDVGWRGAHADPSPRFPPDARCRRLPQFPRLSLPCRALQAPPTTMATTAMPA